ncbi:MAG: hypothetical protein RSE12_17075 [Fuscovulum sp.]|nr:MAG: hypothetical protein RSE12_17075 [Fuscovulum sp.]
MQLEVSNHLPELKFTDQVMENLKEYHAFLAEKKKIQWAYIYGLIDPRTDDVRYIGKSIRPYQRLQNHMNDVSKCHRSHWLQELKRAGLRPELWIMDRIEADANWQELERDYIEHGHFADWPLTNSTSGGDGVCNLPPETRERMRATWLGRKHRAESLVRIGDASRGRHHSEDHKARMSAIMAGRKITWVCKVSAALAKLSQEDQSAILQSLSEGATVKYLAEKYGVHRTTISKVKMGQYAPRASGGVAA